MIDQTLKAIPELVVDAVYRTGKEVDGIYFSKFGGVVPIVVYDHDWQFHVLVRVWDDYDDNPKWAYSLWFVDSDGATKVRDFPEHEWGTGNIPYVASALVVEEWHKSLSDGNGQ